MARAHFHCDSSEENGAYLASDPDPRVSGKPGRLSWRGGSLSGRGHAGRLHTFVLLP
jgi:hypothetical protein